MNDTHTPIDDLIAVSTGSPEKTGMLSSEDKEQVTLHEIVEHEPSEDVKNYVKHRKEIIQLPQDLEKLGGVSTGTSSFPTTRGLTLPISDDQILQGKSAPISSSLRWMVEFCLFLLKQAHLTLKNVHGKIIRVVRN